MPKSVDPRFVQLTTGDGVSLAARVFDKQGSADMTVLMLPGIGVPQRAFRHIAAWFSEQGARCLTIDYRGIGESRASPEAVGSATLLTWARIDAVAALEYIETRWREPVVLLGHSFGGQMLGLAEPLQRVRAAVLVGSQLGQPRNWDGLSRLKFTAYWYLILPIACSFFDPLPAFVGFGTPLPRGVASEWAKWGRSPEWFLTWESSANETFAAFGRPVLAYAIEDDDIAPPRAAEALLQRLRSAEITKRDVSPREVGLPRIGHMGFFKAGFPESIWQEVLDFYRRHL